MNKLQTYSKIFLKNIVIVENHLGENGDDCKKNVCNINYLWK